MNRSYHFGRRATSLLSLAFSLLLLPALVRAQQSFPATHIMLLHNVSSIPDSSRGAGVGIFRIDPSLSMVQYRISVVTPGLKVTDVHIRVRGEGDPADDITLQTFTLPEGAITAEATLDIIIPAVFDYIDAGRLYLDFRTEEYPDGYMTGIPEPIPNGVALELEPSQEVPKADSTSALGSAAVVIDPVAKRVRYYLNWRRLTGPAQQAHFHMGAAGEVGPPIHSIALTPGDSTARGVWENVSDDVLRAFREGRIYANVHTARYPNGEIRGQILPTETFTAAIESANEVETPTTLFATGTGYLVMVTYPGLGTFFKSIFVVGNTTDSITMAHIHRGAEGENGPVIMPYEKSLYGEWEIQREIPADQIAAENMTAIRTGNSYINVHTAANQNGEARGQLIPSILNVASSVPANRTGPESSTLAARIDAGSGAIRFTIAPGVPAGPRRIALYSALGEQVASVETRGDAAEIDAHGLPAGLYLAQLVVDGKALGVCRIVR